MRLDELLNVFHLSRVTIHFRVLENVRLNKNTGKAFRGMVGKIFKKSVCTNPVLEIKYGTDSCKLCVHRFECPYAVMFESYNPGSLPNMKKPKIPHPYFIELPQQLIDENNPSELFEYNQGEVIKLNLTLIGTSIKYLRHLIFAYNDAGRNDGIGFKNAAGKGRIFVDRVIDDFDNNRQIYTSAEGWLKKQPEKKFLAELIHPNETLPKFNRLKVTFSSRTRLDFNHKIVGFQSPDIPEYSFFRNSLLKRLQHLSGFYCGYSLDFEDFSGNVKIVNQSLIFRDDKRDSKRQTRPFPYGGVVGDIVLDGDLAEEYYLLKAGEIIHVGKGTDIGMGQYNITPL